MRRILLIIIVAAITVAIAWWIAGLPGHVDVTIAGITVDASAPVAVLGLIIVVAIVYFFLRLIASLLAIPMGWRRMRSRSRRKGGDSAVTQTLVAIAAGDRGDARRAAARARRLHGDTPQTMLLAAEASRLAGDEEGAAEIYRKLADHEDAAFLGLRGLFRQAVAREDWAEASQIAQRADRLHPGASWLREERAHLAVRTRNWGAGGPTRASRHVHGRVHHRGLGIRGRSERGDAAGAAGIPRGSRICSGSACVCAPATGGRARAEGRRDDWGRLESQPEPGTGRTSRWNR